MMYVLNVLEIIELGKVVNARKDIMKIHLPIIVKVIIIIKRLKYDIMY